MPRKKILLNRSTLKVYKENALAWTSGFERNGVSRIMSIYCTYKGAWVLRSDFRNKPKLITVFPTQQRKFPLSDIGKDLLVKNPTSVPLKYVAVLNTIYHIKNKFNVCKELCTEGLFDIWEPEAPYGLWSIKKSNDYGKNEGSYNPSNEKTDPMILLIRVYELDREFSTGDIDLNNYFDTIKSEREVLLNKPIISDEDFDKIKVKIESILTKHNAYSDKVIPNVEHLVEENYFAENNLSYEKKLFPFNKDVALLLRKKQIILYGPSGTGKTFSTKNLAIDLIIENDLR